MIRLVIHVKHIEIVVERYKNKYSTLIGIFRSMFKYFAAQL